jgi:hypothetical protein
VTTAVAASATAITHLRGQDSTSTPAMGLNRTSAPELKNPIRASVVTRPVWLWAQMVSANRVMAVPKVEMSWHDQV